MRSLVFLATAMATTPATAADNDFYRGKTISLVINYTVGGPTDTEVRLLARHINKHIPGAPTIVVRNMGGAGGAIGINWLGQAAPNDGYTVGYMTGIVGATMHDQPTVKIDASKLGFVAGVEAISVGYGRTDLGSGLKEPFDLMKQSNFWMGGLSPDGNKDLRLRMQLDLLGLKYRYISGYPGAADARLALERKEVEMTAESLPTYRMTIEPALVDTGRVIPLWLDVADEYADKDHPDTAGIKAPTFETYYRKAKGEPPKSTLWEVHRMLKEFGTVFLRTINLPPGSPAVATELWRDAIAGLVGDEEYRQDAIKTIKYVPRFYFGPNVERKYRESIVPDPAIVAFTSGYIREGYVMMGK